MVETGSWLGFRVHICNTNYQYILRKRQYEHRKCQYELRKREYILTILQFILTSLQFILELAFIFGVSI